MDPFSAALAWWGAALSTLLGAIHIHDRFFRRPVPVIGCSLTSSAEVGNEVSISNPAAVPIMVRHWSLYWAKPLGFRLRRGAEVCCRDLSAGVTTVGPHSTVVLLFEGMDHFGWGGRWIEAGQLYIEIHVIGRRRPLVLHIYNPGGDTEPWSARRMLPHAWRQLPTFDETVADEADLIAGSFPPDRRGAGEP